MTTQLTDEERAAIEQEIRALRDGWNSSGERIDWDDMVSHVSDVYDLGFVRTGHFFPSLGAWDTTLREAYSRRERQEMHEPTELRVAVLAPNVAVMTDLLKVTVHRKDGTTFTSPFARTFVCARVEGEWKVIHLHSSIPPQA